MPAAQQAVELGEQIQDALAQLRIVGGDGEGGSPCGEIGAGTFRDGVEVGVVRSEQGVCQCRIIKGKGFHEGRWRCGFLHRFGRRRGRRGTVCRVRRERRFDDGEKALPGNAAFPSVASGTQGRLQPTAFAAKRLWFPVSVGTQPPWEWGKGNVEAFPPSGEVPFSPLLFSFNGFWSYRIPVRGRVCAEGAGRGKRFAVSIE